MIRKKKSDSVLIEIKIFKDKKTIGISLYRKIN